MVRVVSFISVLSLLSACGSSTVPENLRGLFNGQEGSGNRFLPLIDLNGDEEINLEVYSNYVELGATAKSLSDGDIDTGLIEISSNINTSVIGSYTVTYSVTDSTGRSSSLNRVVNVVDTTRPVLAIQFEPSRVFEKLGFGNPNLDPYNDGVPGQNGIAATDNYDTAINSKISAVSNVNSSLEGDYFVTYNVKDQSDNPAEPVARIVQVRDTYAPGIAIGAPSSTMLSQFSNPVEYLVNFQDAYQIVDFQNKVQIEVQSGNISGCVIETLGAGLEVRVVRISGCQGNGVFKLRILAGAAIDNATIPAPNATSQITSTAEITVNNVAPTVTISNPSPNLVNQSGPTVNFDVTVSNLNGGSVNLTVDKVELVRSGSADCSGINVIGGTTSNPDVQISNCSGDGSIQVRIASQTAVSGLGVPSGPSNLSGPFTVDNTAPLVTIGAPSLTIANQDDQIDFAVTVTGATSSQVQSSDVLTTYAGGVVCSKQVLNPNSFNPTVRLSNCSGNGSVRIEIAAGVAEDAANNQSVTSGLSNSVSIDNTRPVVNISTPSLTLINQATPVQFGVSVVGADVVNLTSAQVDLQIVSGNPNCAKSVSNGQTSNPTVTLSNCSGNGNVRIRIQAGIAQDLAGNTSLETSPSASVTVDNLAPSVNIATPSLSVVNQATPVDFPITVLGATQSLLETNDLTIEYQASASGCISSIINPSSMTPIVRLSSCMGNGAVRIQIQAGIATDGVNLSTISNFSSFVTVDNIVPIVSIGNPTKTLINSSTPVQFPITVTGATIVSLDSGDVLPAYEGGVFCTVQVTNGTTMSPTVQFNNCSGDGSFRFRIAAGVASDGVNQSAQTELSQAITIDNTAPIISIVPQLYSLDLCDTSTTYQREGVSVNEGLPPESILITQDNVNPLNATINYQVSYSATDLAGNVAVASRTVDVMSMTVGMSGQSPFDADFALSVPADLETLRAHIESGIMSNWTLCGNLDFESESIAPLGQPDIQANGFRGRMDGRSFRIKNLNIEDVSNPNRVGFFRRLENEDSLIRNIIFENIQSLGSQRVGIVAGLGEGKLDQVAVIGNSLAEGSISVGGLVGELSSTGSVSSSFSVAEVQASNRSAGGLVGTNFGNISDSYRPLDGGYPIVAPDNLGGIVGNHDDGSIVRSYSNTVDLCLIAATDKGALIGRSGGGSIDSTSIWNSDLSGFDPMDPNCNQYGTALTDVEIRDPLHFTDEGWSVEIWSLLLGEYPKLLWFPY